MLPRPTRLMNKTPAPIQITAEKIIRESREPQEPKIRPPRHQLTNATDLSNFRQRKQNQFEDLIRCNISVWTHYAQWEEAQNDLNRARSVWERALETNKRNHTLWLKYTEFKAKNKFINRARNVFDCAVTLFPRVDQLWYKYIHMEEMLGNVSIVRQIFERWMNMTPSVQVWLCFIKFELRYNEFDRAREIFERFVQCHSNIGDAWIAYARFESKNEGIARARNVYERAVGNAGTEQIFVAFAEFEERCKEYERARCIYKYALPLLGKVEEELYAKFVAFKKQYGDKEGIEDAIMGKRRKRYEEEVRENGLNYDLWFEYIRLEESVGDKERIREVC